MLIFKPLQACKIKSKPLEKAWTSGFGWAQYCLSENQIYGQNLL
jgi:hypothetical protein